MATETDLPQKEELVAALAEQPLGNGSEASVYKIHMRPQFTLRVSHDLPRKDLSQKILEADFIVQEDIFSGRLFGQTVAYLSHPDLLDSYSKDPLITINYYSRGHDYTIVKDSKEKPTEQETLSRTIAVTKMLVDPEIFPDKAYDGLFDKLKFLSSKQYTIDVGNDLFCNTGNILPSVQDHKFFIIDVMPFIPAEKLRLAIHPALNPQHTKGCNSPLFLARGLLYGYLPHQNFHGQNAELTMLRTKLLNRIVDGAVRSQLSEQETYLFEPMVAWKRQLTRLNIPQQEQEKLMKKIRSISDSQPYRVAKKMPNLVRIGGWYVNQQ
ncbi:MAG: hypothetical protein IKQ99_01850 [Alphaproteobacteria bacterium]|nr:hypothetical protein [Alphaproteobacteria bacterium]